MEAIRKPDCLGTAARQGLKSVKQFELLPKPTRTPRARWDCVKIGTDPTVAVLADDFRTSSAHEKASNLCGGQDCRDFSILSKSFSGEDGVVKKLHGIRLEWTRTRKPAARR